MEVDEKGKRRVSWDGAKGGAKNFKWITRACAEIGKSELGLGTNKVEAQQPLNSSLGPHTISPTLSELGECSKESEGPIPFARSFEKAGENLVVLSTSFVVPTQVAGGLVKPHKAWAEAKNG